MDSSKISAESVREALSGIVDPTLERPMLEAGTISDISVKEGRVSLVVTLGSPAEELRDGVREEILTAIKGAGVSDAEVTWKIRVPSREVMGDDPIPEVRNVILVMSGKGGVGKSTVSTNLALAFKRMGGRVGLMDADVYGPSIPTMLGVQEPPYSEDGKSIKPLARFGINLMSIGFLTDDPKEAVIWRGPMLHSALRQFIADVDWGPLDYLIVDLPPGTGDVALSISQLLKVTGAVVVTTPQEVALQDVYKGVSMCSKLGIPVLGVVENMSFFVDPQGNRHELFGAGGGEKVAEMAEAPLLGQIPIDPMVREWGDKGTPVVQAAPRSEPGTKFMRIAEALGERIVLEHFERTGGKSVLEDGPKRLKVIS